MAKKAQKLSREEQAKLEIGHTAITKMQKIIVSGIFLLLIFGYFICQAGHELRSGAAASIRELKSWGIFKGISELKTGTLSEMNHGVITAVKNYEDTLEEVSLLRQLLLADTQEIMVAVLGMGNEKVIIGSNGFLFYSGDFNYLVNPGFMRKEQLQKRALSGVQPNPVTAIVDFDKQLKSRNIKLILLPVPVKPMLYPDKLAAPSMLLQNKSYEEFRTQLEAAGVTVVDPAEGLFRMRSEGREPYLKSDTHWTPAGAGFAAAMLAREINGAAAALPEATEEIINVGDIAKMLKLTDPGKFFPAEQVEIARYPQNYSKNGRVLLLGDSFTNIYDAESMNWGESAGFGRMLAAALDEDIDVIAINDAGAYATRQLLSNEMRSGRDRLANKEFVIYEFAIRELADGDWKLLDITLGMKPEVEFISVDRAGIYRAEVLECSIAARPNSAPYKDHVMSLHLGNLNSDKSSEALVYIESMRDNVLQPAARLAAGAIIEIELSPWEGENEEKYSSWNRSELDDSEVILQQPCWGRILK